MIGDKFTRSKSTSKIHADYSHVFWFSPRYPDFFVAWVTSIFFSSTL